MGKLNDKAVATKQAQEKQYAVADGDGLTLAIKPNGTKLWWLRYRFAGKAKTLSIGIYPAVSLKQARKWTWDARKLLADGINPGQIKIETKAAQIAAAIAAPPAQPIDTLEEISREWLGKFSNR